MRGSTRGSGSYSQQLSAARNTHHHHAAKIVAIVQRANLK